MKQQIVVTSNQEREDKEEKLMRTMANLIIDKILEDRQKGQLKFQDRESNITGNDD